MGKLSFKIDADWSKVQKLREEIARLKQEIKGTDAIQTPTAFNNLNNKLQQTSKELGNVTGKIAQASATMETDFRQKIYAASQGVNAFTEKIIAQKAVVKDVAADVKRLGEAYRDTKKYSPMSADGKLAEWKAAKRALGEEKAALFGLTQEQATARLSVKRLNDEYKTFRQEGGGTTQTMDLLTSKMKNIGMAVMGGMGLKELASRIISVRADFESMETSLKVLLGGNQERLNNIMGQIKEYALASPLNTKDMVGAVQMMTSFGIEAEKSIDYLKAIGDISMGNTGKFNSLALAFSQMSSAGKLMGQDLNQMVNAGFNPLEEISRKTGKSIGELKEEMSKGAITSKMVQDAFISVTSAGGKFYGMASEGAKTLNGQISMLQESFDNMFNELGSKGEGVVMTAVQTATKLVENYEQVGRVLLGLIETYGAYRVGLAIATVAENGHTLAMTLARAQILLTQKAQALLNATMLSNPYVLAATALGVLIGAMVMQKTQTDRVNDATERYNEEKEKIIEQEKQHTEEIQRLCDISGDESLSTENRRLALVKLEQIYPSIFKKYDTEAAKLAHILEIKQQIAALDGKNSITNAKNEEDRINKRLQSIGNSLKARQTGASGYKDNNIGTNTQSLYDEQKALLKRKGEINKHVSKITSDAYLSNLTGISNADLNRQIKQRKNLLAQMSLTGKKYGKTTIGGAKGVFSREELEGQIGVLESEKTRRTHKPAITKKDLQDQKKALQTQLDGLSEIEAKGKKGAAIKKKIAAITARENAAYSTSSSSVSGKTGKGGNVNTFDPIKAQSNIDAQKAALSQAQIELENQVEQARIDALTEGSEKTLAAMQLAHKKELEQIDKQKEEYLKKKQDEAEAEFKAEPKNKDKTFDRSTVALSADEQSKFDAIRNNTLKKQSNEEEEAQLQRIDALNAYLKEYGTFEEKKLAITQEYEEKIRKAGSVGEKATIEMQRDKEIEKAKNDDLQNSIDWNGIFSDLQGHTKQYLQGLRNQLQELLNTGNLPIDQMQTVSEKITAIDDELGKQQGIWDFVGERTREHNRLLKEAADAQERLNIAKAEEVGANANLGFAKMDVQKRLSDAGVEMNIGDISTAKLNGKIDLTDEKFKGMVPILQKLAVAEGRLTEARKKTADATNKAKQKEDATKRKPAQEIADWFSDAQEFITKKGIDQLPDLLGSVGLGKAGDKVAKGLEGFNSAKEAAADFASGNYIGAAFKGISAIKSFGSALGIGGGNEKQVAETTERLMKSNELLADRIDDLSEVIGNSAGNKAVNAYDTALKAQEEITANNMDILKAQMGYNSKHHSNAYYADDLNIASYNKDAQLAFKAAGVDSSNITGLDSIYSLSPEQLKAIKDFAPNLWKYLTEVGKYDKTEYWDQVVEQAGKTEELTKQIQDNLTLTSFDNLRNGFLDTLMDMDSDAEDWSTNFSKMLFKSIVNSNIMGDEFDSWLKKFQEKWAEKLKSGNMSKQDYADYRKESDSKMQELKTQTNNLAASVGYSGTDSQNATANGISNISYDQADNLTGIMTSIQIAGEQRNTKLDTISGHLSVMNVTTEDIRRLMAGQMASSPISSSATREIINNSYTPQIQVSFPKEELQDINRKVGDLAAVVDEMRTHGAERLMEQREISENTGKMVKNGMEIKSYVSDIKKDAQDMAR